MKFILICLAILAIAARWTNGTDFSVAGKSRFFNNKVLRLIKESMDVDTEPCVDFYQHACGYWQENHEDVPYKSTQHMLNYQVNEEMDKAMSTMSYRNKTGFVRNALDFYNSCKSVAESTNVEYIRWLETHDNITSALFESSEDSDVVQYDWVHMLATMRMYGMRDAFLDEDIFADVEDPLKKTIGLNKPYSMNEFVEFTREDLADIFPEFEDTLDDLWNEVHEFEQRLAELADVQDEQGKVMIHVEELPLPWLQKYLTVLLGEAIVDPALEVTIQNVAYMQALDALLQEYDDKFICKYLEVSFLWYIYQQVSTLSGPDCIEATRGLLPLAMHWIYEQQHPEIQEEIPRIISIFDSILKQTSETLKSDQTGLISALFLEKLDKIQLKVGNLPRGDTVAVLESLYSNLTTNASDFYGNHLKLLHFRFQLDHTINTYTLNTSEFFELESLYQGSSFEPFVSAKRIVILPLTLLRQPFYHWGYNDFYTYSSLGIQMAKVILSVYEFKGLSTDEVQKISDIASLHIAYDAFFNRFTQKVEDDKVVNSTKKLFFLNAAQSYCDSDATEDDSGPLAKRLNDITTISSKFAEAYECKLYDLLKEFFFSK